MRDARFDFADLRESDKLALEITSQKNTLVRRNNGDTDIQYRAKELLQESPVSRKIVLIINILVDDVRQRLVVATLQFLRNEFIN